MKFFTKLITRAAYVCLLVLCPMLAFAQPANDLCSNAIIISCGAGPYTGNNTGATTTGDPSTSCSPGGGTPGPLGVWYKYAGNGDIVTLATCGTGTNYDTKLYVYTGSCGSFTCVAGNDDFCAPASQVTFTSITGTDYFVLITGYDATEIGNYSLAISCVTPPPAPANDLCANATLVACGDTVAGTNVNATGTGQPTIACGPTTPGNLGVWYRVVGNGQIITASTCATVANSDHKLYVYTGTCGAANLTCVGSNDDFCGLRPSYSFPSTTGTDYYILITGITNGTAPFILTVNCVVPAVNDLCANAIPITCTSGTVYGTNAGSTNTGNPATCTTAPGTNAVWYTFAGTGEHITLSTCDSANFNTKLNVYSGVCGTLNCITGNDDFAACAAGNTRSEVKFSSVLGTTYYVLVSGLTTATGNFGLRITCAPSTAANDSCLGAIVVACGSTTNGSISNATNGGDQTSSCGSVTPGNYGVWYSFIGTGDGISFSTCAVATNFDTKINVYTGTCASPTCLTGNDNAIGCTANSLASGLSFNSVLGTQYYIQVTGTGGASGAFQLSTTCSPPPANDLCINATVITCGTTVSGSNVGATNTDQPAASCNSTSPGTFGVWYSYVGTGNYTVFSTCNASNFDTKIHVYTGSCGVANLTCLTANDDFTNSCSNNSSRVGLQSVSGTTYYVLVTGFNTAIGNFSLSTLCYGGNTAAIDSCTGNYTALSNDTINNTLPVTRDTLTINTNTLDTITDLNVIVNLNHTSVGQLTVILTHLASGRIDTLVKTPVSLNSTTCNQNGINAKFDDGAFSPIVCGPSTGTDSSALQRGPYQPFRPLSIFNGDLLGGQWELRVVDATSGENGKLISWCLQPTARPYVCTNPVATFRDSCNPANSAFFVIADITNLGNAPSLNITNTANATVVTANAVGSYVLGPFTPGTTVDVTLTNSASSSCFLTSAGRTSNCIIQNPCVSPSATITAKCNPAIGTTFYVEVAVTDIGSGPSLTITNSLNATTIPVTAAGTYTVGPFANNAVVDVTIANDTAAGCNVTALNLTKDCTPVCTTGVFAGRDTTICAGQPVQLGDLATAPLQTVQFENFNACALPSGWTRTALQGTANWAFSIPTYGGTGAIDGTCLVHFNDDAAGNGNYNIVALTSPPIDLSTYTGADLSLDLHYYHRDYQTVYPSSFEIQVWDGTAYQVLQNYKVQVNGTTWASFANVTFSLTPYLNPALHIRFLYDDGNGWNQWVGFDNFKIDAIGSASGTYAWTPATGLNDATSSVPVATPTATTTYIVEHVDGLCTYRDTVVITVNQLPVVAIAGAANNYCITDTARVQLFGLPAGGIYAGSGVTGSTFRPSAAGAGTKILSYTYTDGNGCTATDRDTVEVNPQPTVTLTTSRSQYCLYDLPDTLRGTPAGGTYSGQGVTGNIFNPSAAGAGSHTVSYIYQSPTTGCGDTMQLTLGVINVPVTFAAPGGPYCANDTNRVPLSVTPTGGTFAGPGIQNGQFRPSAAGAGTHTLVYYIDSFVNYVVDTNCTYAPVTAPASPSSVVLGDDAISSAINLPFTFKFFGQSKTQVRICSNGWITFNPATTSTSFANINLANATVPNDVVAGMWDDLAASTVQYYTVGTAPNRIFVVHFNSTHLGTPNEVVNFQILLHETSNMVQIQCIECNTDASDPTASQGIKDATGAIRVVVPGRDNSGWSAFNDCTAFLPSGCSFSATQDVTVNPTPTASAGNDTSICLGGTATLRATGGSSYLWNNGLTTATITVSPGITTPYSVRVTSASGCISRDTVVVTILPTPVVNLPNPTICQGSNTTLDAGNAGATYNWSTSAQTQTITVTTAGNYIVTVTLGSCSVVDTAVVTISTSLAVNLGNPSICPGDTATLNAGNPGASYIWSTSAQTQTIKVSTPGTYSVTVTDANSCSGTGTSTVTLSPVPTVNLPDPTICVGSNTTLSAGNTGATFNWSTGDNTQSITVSNGGNYIVTVTNSFGCDAVDTATVTVGTGLVVTLPNLSICPGDTATLDAGYPGSTYMWSTGDTTQTVKVTTNGGFVVTVTDNAGCSGVGGGSVSVRVPQQVNAGADMGVCPGQSITLTATGNVVSYQWTGGPATASYTVSPTVTTTYTVTGTDANGCTSTDQVVVGILALPNANAGADAVACDSGSVTLTATGGVSYVWSNGSQMASTTVSPSAATTYTVTVTDANGCTATDAVGVTIAPLPTVTIGGLDSAYCVSDPLVTLTGTPAGGTFSGVGVTGNTFNPAIGQYGSNVIIYSYTDANGCTGIADRKFNVNYCVGIDEPIFSESVKVYPNPFSNEIFVSFDAAYEHTITLRLSDMLGRTISTQEVHIIAGTNDIRLNASEDLAGGIYFVELHSLKESRSFKMVKVR